MDQATPTTPGPRTGSRSFSFRSDKSGGSAGRPRIDDLTESPREKERRDSIWKNQSKANPNAAMNEAQPGEVNILEQTTIESLRSIQHKDGRGNVITDPDLANPTRPRMERPLDTIRNFEKNIENGYKRRTSLMRGESYNDQNGSQYASRRSSYYDYNEGRNRRPHLGGGYYGSQRPDSYADSNGQGQQRMRYDGRMQSDSAIPRQNGWPNHMHSMYGQHDSAGNAVTPGSDSTGPWTASTDPSSENSSIERMNVAAKPQPGHETISEEGAYLPKPPAHGQPYPQAYQQRPMEGQRRPIPLNNSGMARSGPKQLPPTPQRPEPEKRQSWLKRTFSKKG